MRVLRVTALLFTLCVCSSPESDSPRDSDPNQRHSAAVLPGIRAAGDSVVALLAEWPKMRVDRSDGEVLDSRTGEDVPGCRVKVSGSRLVSDDNSSPDFVLRRRLRERGWREDIRFCADGPDGTAFAMDRNGITYLFRASWDGGDISDPAYVPDPRYELVITCVSTQADTTASEQNR